MLPLYHFFVFAGLLIVLANVLANLARFGRLRAATPPEEGPLVSILVPARNEAQNIEECLRSLLLQDYTNYELIVLDDHSEDRTAEIAERLIAQIRTPRMSARLLRGKTLPAGWTGKNWACHQLFEAASGDFLFFTDADTVHAPGTVTAAVDYACRHDAGLVSAWPRQITGTLGEQLIVPSVFFLGLSFCPIWLQRLWQDKPQLLQQRYARDVGVANGQFMFFTRATYEAVGGHDAVRGHVVEDVALGREVSARMGEGLRLFNCDSLDFTTVRMYRSFGETWAGFSKNMRAVFERNALGFWLMGLGELILFVLPFVWLFLTPETVRHMVYLQLGAIYTIRFLLAYRFRTSLLGALLHPLGMVLMLLIGLNSWRQSIGRGVRWKGRYYHPEI